MVKKPETPWSKNQKLHGQKTLILVKKRTSVTPSYLFLTDFLILKTFWQHFFTVHLVRIEKSKINIKIEIEILIEMRVL